MKKIFFTLMLASILFHPAYSVQPGNDITPFKIKKAEYSSWVLEENIRGTDLFLKLSHADRDIVFKSITFRGIEVPVSVIRKGRRVRIKGTVNVGEPMVEPGEFVVTGQSSRLSWESGGISRYTDISFRRKEK